MTTTCTRCLGAGSIITHDADSDQWPRITCPRCWGKLAPAPTQMSFVAGDTATVPTLPINPLPTLGLVHYDQDAQEWYARDSDGVTFWGDQRSEVASLFSEAMYQLRENARKSGITLAEECRMRSEAAQAQHDRADR